MSTKYTRVIAHEIVSGRLPDAALEWNVIELALTTVLRGSGESTSYHPHATVRRNGKQIWRGTPYEFESAMGLGGITQSELIEAGKYGRNKLFVEKPT